VFFHGTASSPEVTDCTFTENSALEGGGAIACDAASNSHLSVVRCTFIDNEATGFGGGAIEYYPVTIGDLVVAYCTFSANSAATGAGILCRSEAHAVVDNTILAFGVGGEGIACSGIATATLACCDVYGNEGGDWTGCIENQFPGNGNFHEDPLFCGAQNPESPYSLHSTSSLASPYGPCGPIGAWPVGCGDLSEVHGQAPSQASWRLAPPQPNPFTRETRLVLDPWPDAPLSIRVYDSAGRCVRTLPDDCRSGGVRVVSWDGMDDRGMIQRSGIYFVRIQAAGAATERSVLLLR